MFGLETSPGRLEEVEERLALFARLERKHGGSIADVLAHAERCRARREELERVEIALSEVEASLAEARAELDRLAGELSARRREAAPALAAAVRERLAELAMPDAEFEVEVRPREDGCGPRGADEVSLVIAPNPGMPAGPLREIASGGELSRVMLAILSVAHGSPEGGVRRGWAGRRPPRARRRTGGVPAAPDATEGPLLVFDEIDAGIGGHTARAVGEHLRALAEGRQILCITHLPQVAAMAARHFTIVKDSSAAPARTTVSTLGGNERRRRARPDAGRGRGRPGGQPPRPPAVARRVRACTKKRPTSSLFRPALPASGAVATFRSSRPHYTRETN